MSAAAPSRAWLGALVVFVVALGARLVALEQIEAHYPLADRVVIDEESYETRALEIVGGDWIGTEVFFQEPLYPYWIASVYAVLGPDRGALRVVQAVLGAGVAAAVFGLARRLFGPLAGWVAGLSIAVHRALLFLPALLLKPNLFLPVWLGIVWLLALGPTCGRLRRRALALGVLTGLGALLRGNVVLLAPLLVAWPAVAAWRARGPRASLALSGLTLAGVLSVLGPVAVRNLAVGGVFTLTTSGAGTNVYGGNNPQNPYGRATEFDWVRGIPEYEADDWRREAERRAGRELGPGEVSAFWLGETWASIRRDPALHAEILWNKLRLSLGAYEVPDNHSLDWAGRHVPILSPWFPGRPLWGTLGLAGLALFVLRRGRGAERPGGAAGALLWLLYLGTIVATVTAMRARLPLVPLEALFAGYGLAVVVREPRADAREWARRAGALALGAAAVLVPVFDADQYAADLDKRDFNHAVYLLEDGALERAERVARDLAERRPASSRVETLLAQIEAARGFEVAADDRTAGQVWIQSALDRLRAVLAAPGVNARERFRASALAGGIMLELGRFDVAERRLRDALAFDADDRELRRSLARALAGQGRVDEAVAVLEALVAERPGDPAPAAELEALRAASGGGRTPR